MGALRVILWDQLSWSLSSLEECEKKDDYILLIESSAQATFVKHHKKKLLFLWSAQRHFAKELKKKKYNVIYFAQDDAKPVKTLTDGVKRALKESSCEQIIITEPSEYHTLKEVKTWKQLCKVPVEIREDNRFLASKETFKTWAKNKKQLRMEFFYREIRKQTGYLMNGSKPIGGKWNYDSKNRGSYDGKKGIPRGPSFKPNAVVKKVATLINKKYADHLGETTMFSFAVTRAQGLKWCNHFIKDVLPDFGKYQDAMVEGKPYMFHSIISMYINAGLLLPTEVCEKACEAYSKKKAPLEAVEGFIRQIIGWREFIRGIYWLKMPKYKKLNFFQAKKALPNFYWTGDTKMNCMKQSISDTVENGYAHHIQRLMVTGNFALLAGLKVQEVCKWYHIVYVDAHEWVELPNTLGMALCGDGGFFASKPYAASGSYINKMSDYCKKCEYNVNEKEGPDACPFNYLYWNFIMKQKTRLKKFQRMAMPLNTLKKMSPERKKSIKADARKFLKNL